MKQKLIMKDLPLSEKPYELLESLGASALTDAQLLAILLKTGTREENALETALRILATVKEEEGSSEPFSLLFRMPFSKLTQFRGVGRVKAIQIKAVAEIAHRLSVRDAQTRMTVKDSASIACVFMEKARDLTEEHVWYLLVDTKLHMICLKELGKGNLNQTLIDAKEIFLDGREKGAYAFVLLHNHPSGDPTPSQCDNDLTRILRKQGEIMQMPLLDHIIIGRNTYYSYTDAEQHSMSL
ncbi:MAG: DNA repair protein RadC [Lachnospiraceae bacterium]|nr:DNA repair protein RadC [Lachnospiraceae bacterium]